MEASYQGAREVGGLCTPLEGATYTHAHLKMCTAYKAGAEPKPSED